MSKGFCRKFPILSHSGIASEAWITLITASLRVVDDEGLLNEPWVYERES